jgi:GTP cyclohydrolase II
MTNNPKKIEELEKHGVRVVERVPLVIAPNPDNERYLQTKKEQMGHLLGKGA